MSPPDIIDYGYTSTLVIICRYNVKHFDEFLLMQNDNHAVLRLKYYSHENYFYKDIQRDGFDCTPIKGYKGQITCWKFNPTCKDAANYTCRSATETSKPKTLKARSFMKSLDIVNPPIEVDKTLVFRCAAYVTELYGYSNFLWFERKLRDTRIHMNTVEAQRHFECLIPVVSFHRYTVKHKDVGFTNITCFLNGETLTKLLIKQAGSEQKPLGQTNNAEKLYSANIITKILTFATYMLFISNLR
ncbi:uncharacterized protein LOC106880715 isoform X5 [Octopus bimaculoides]|nr:uncharacterized protein LOC106880715 isoform X5 [Octopus bimaculoides]